MSGVTIGGKYFEYQSNVVKRHVAQGKREGRVQLILKLLTLRFGTLSTDDEAQVKNAAEHQLDVFAERVLTAPTLRHVLDGDA